MKIVYIHIAIEASITDLYSVIDENNAIVAFIGVLGPRAAAL